MPVHPPQLGPIDILSNALGNVRRHIDLACVIVGGAVRDVLLGREPKDWDVYVLGTTLQELRPRLCHLQPCPPQHGFTRHRMLALETKLDAFDGPFQFFATPAVSAAELLDASDWNVSAFAFDGREVLGRDNVDEIGPGRPLRLLNISNPISTLKRGFDFASRFEMEFRSSDVVTLCKAVAGGRYATRPAAVRTSRPARRRFL